MATMRCEIHDKTFETSGGAPGTSRAHPLKGGKYGHHDCPSCDREKDGPKVISVKDATDYSKRNNLNYEKAAQVLAEQGYEISDDPAVIEAAKQERARVASERAKREAVQAAVNPSNATSFPDFEEQQEEKEEVTQ